MAHFRFQLDLNSLEDEMIVFVREYFFLEGRPNISRSFVSVRKRVFMYSTSSFKESVADGRGFLTFSGFYFIFDRPSVDRTIVRRV